MQDTPTAPSPIFVIGSPRSGTTMLRLMLDTHPTISCGEETHIIPSLERVVGSNWRLVQEYGFPKGYWIERLAVFYGGAMTEYATRRGKVRWADKDPSNTLVLPFVDAMFPDAQYIHIIRDGHDVVASYRDRWGYRSAIDAARRVWRTRVEAARAFGASLPEGRFHELRYERLVGDPETQLRDLFGFLGEPWDPAVLTFDQAEHDGTVRYSSFTAERREQGGDPATIYRSRVGAGRSSLDPVLKRILRRSSGALLDELGYGEP